VNSFAQKGKGLETWKKVQNMEGEEERGIVTEGNSQKDAAADETNWQKERSQTPQVGSDRGSDDDDDKEDEVVLNITRITTTLTQYEQHCNRAYRSRKCHGYIIYFLS
jgi:hypothetical protein